MSTPTIPDPFVVGTTFGYIADMYLPAPDGVWTGLCYFRNQKGVKEGEILVSLTPGDTPQDAYILELDQLASVTADWGLGFMLADIRLSDSSVVIQGPEFSFNTTRGQTYV